MSRRMYRWVFYVSVFAPWVVLHAADNMDRPNPSTTLSFESELEGSSLRVEDRVGKPLVVSLSKPNIVHIMIDDLGWQDIASHRINGDVVYDTPNLDALTREGRRFTQAYSPAPTCAPSRSSFLVGRYPAHTRIYHVTGSSIPRGRGESPMIAPYYPYGLPGDAVTIPQMLKKAGYVSGHVGKWHAGGKSEGYPFPLDLGFDFGFTDRSYNDVSLWNPKDGGKNQFFGSWRQMRPDRISDFATDDPSDPFQLDAEGRPFDKPLDLALGFMRKNKEDPFFLSFCTFYVHGPIGTRDRTRLEKYCKKMGYDFPTDPGIINEGNFGQTNPYYASMVDTVDWMVGKVVRFLEQADDPRNPGHKLIDNTYVILDADNGGCVAIRGLEPVTDNSPLQEGKVTTFEGGLRIPFLVRGPGITPGSTCDTPINLVDLFPTFMAMAGVEPDPELELDGCNILPLMKGEADEAVFSNGEARDTMFWYFPVESSMTAIIRKGGWKLTHNYGMSRGKAHPVGQKLFRLYNNDGSADDLGETRDLSVEFPELKKTMLAELNAFLENAEVSLPYRNPEFAEKAMLDAMTTVGKRGATGNRIWAEFDATEEKAEVTEAFLLYTLNPKPFDSTRGHREEWFQQPATLTKGRVEATVPRGTTHAICCMRDGNNLLVTAEESAFGVQGNFAYKPGLHALIALGENAVVSAKKAGANPAEIDAALIKARAVYRAKDVKETGYADAIRSLRAAIRNQKGIPEASNPILTRFPTDPLF